VKVAVADTGPLIHLAEIDSMELLSVFDGVLVPVTVYEELRAGDSPPDLVDVDYDLVEPTDELDRPGGELDAGETAALTVAAEEGAVLLTDDLDARDAAEDAGVEVHGSIGIIALAFGRDKIDRSTAVELMRSLQRETSLFVTDAVVERGIELLRDKS